MKLYWLFWIVGAFLTFMIPEAWRIIKYHGEGTLSQVTWTLLRVHEGQPLWQWNAVHVLFAIVLFGVAIWACFHLVFGIWA
jgi:hypothetical protein